LFLRVIPFYVLLGVVIKLRYAHVHMWSVVEQEVEMLEENCEERMLRMTSVCKMYNGTLSRCWLARWTSFKKCESSKMLLN
jgi:hypothetical protein